MSERLDVIFYFGIGFGVNDWIIILPFVIITW